MRKFLTAKAELVEKVNDVAKKDGRTIFSIVNEALEEFLMANEKNKSLYEVIEELKTIEIAKNAGMVFVPEEFHENVINRTSLGKNDYKSWNEAGRIFGKYLEVNNMKELKNIERVIKYLIGGVSEILFSENRVVCICPKMSEQRSEELAEFLEGLIESLGFIISSKEISRGIIIIKIKKQKAG
ncbi:MAG: hypothetical protein NZ922_02880 [Candidatus Methanomethyliaceae archaeon]|nr:hypothetical protein [Candidatus Methanomethyliaceae archaeon]MDW7970807.1 hypothetical protein [Nitrososphaerota archaeon]